jgi:Tfp pilus assembly protein PilF
VSQILDSLRRSRKTDARSAPSRSAHGDAVLSTLGYAPPAWRKRYRPAVVIIVLILGLAAAAWLALRSYLESDADPVPPARVLSPGIPRDATPLARATPPSLEHPRNVVAGSPADAVSAVAESGREVSNVGRRALRRETDPHSAAAAVETATISDAAGTTATPRSAENDIELALYYHRTGDYDKALQHYRALLGRNELNAQAHNNLGLLYQQRNLLQESAGELQRAVVLEPRNAGTRNNYGVTLLMLGQLDHAAAEFQTALWLEPENLDALINLSLVQRKSGQLDVARETLLRVLNVSPLNGPAHYNLAQLYDDTNERARAVEHYRLFLDNAGAEHADRAAAVRARIAALNTMSK